MNPTYVYALLDPDTDEVRYIGKTDASTKYRHAQHCTLVKKPKSPRDLWVNGLITRGLFPKMIVLEESRDMGAERRWINHYLQQGARLTNSTNFGLGRYSTAHVDIPKDLKERVREVAQEQSAQTGNVVSISDIVIKAIEVYLAIK
jgi:hypothetical protein